MSAKKTTYLNSPILMLQSNKFTVPLGVSKCRLILEHIDDIKAFVVENPKKEVKENA